MKKVLLTVLATALVGLTAVSLFTGCKKKDGAQSAALAKKITIKVGDNWGETHPVAAALDNVFKVEVEKGIPGATVDVYHNGTLGNEADLWNGVRSGSIEVAIVGTPFNQEWPQSLVSDWPFLYRDIDHAKKVWASAIADDLNNQFHEKFPEAYILAWGPNSARTFTSNKPLTKFEDFRGQKFRMPGNPIHVGIAEGVGASAQVIPLGELFSALETGVVDGQDNGMVTVIAQHFDEVQKYVYETNHIIATLEIVTNAKFLDGLPAEAQAVIRDAAKKAMASAWDGYIAELGDERAYLTGKGVTVTPCSTSDQAKIQAAIKPLVDKLLSDNAAWAPALIQKVQAVR
ncbi:MAG: DctP family TRAP transporter solute-binding subunit [Treponematales bacterium]